MIQFSNFYKNKVILSPPLAKQSFYDYSPLSLTDNSILIKDHVPSRPKISLQKYFIYPEYVPSRFFIEKYKAKVIYFHSLLFRSKKYLFPRIDFFFRRTFVNYKSNNFFCELILMKIIMVNYNGFLKSAKLCLENRQIGRLADTR